jgi:replicative DNA helicase
MTTQYQSSEEFQEVVLACLVRHPNEFTVYAAVLKSSYFTGVQATMVARCLLDYHRDRARFPSFVVLRELAVSAAKGISDNVQQAELISDFVSKLEGHDTGDWSYVRDHIVKFAKEQSVVSAMREAIALLKEGKIPADGFSSMFAKAMEVGTNVEDLGYILHQDSDKVVDKVSNEEYGISTGYPLWDKVWRNGWGPGWLVVPLAPPKRYKTAMSINLALNMVGPAIAENVFYYSCEISQELAMMRALSNIARQPFEAAVDSPERFKETVRNAMATRVAAHCLFKAFASKSSTVADIRAHAHAAINQLGIKPRVIVIDYAETVKPSDKSDQEYRQQSSIYTEARALGTELGCTVIMPDRCNRETVSKSVPNFTSFQGAFEKAGIVDIAIGLCSTEQENQGNTLRMFTFLNRHGPPFQHVRGRVDPQTWKIELVEEIPYDPDADEDSDRPKKKKRSRGPVDEVDDV